MPEFDPVDRVADALTGQALTPYANAKIAIAALLADGPVLLIPGGPCGECAGGGRVEMRSSSGFLLAEGVYDPCPVCGGSGTLPARGEKVGEGWADHFVTFDADGWFVEHSLACRLAGTLGTCGYNRAVREVADDGPPDEDDLGRWRITGIDSEGLPELERAPAHALRPTSQGTDQ